MTARVVAIAGTRPEAIKMAPVMLELRKRADIVPMLLATGQHGKLFDDALAPFDLTPDRRLNADFSGLDPVAMASAVETELTPVLHALKPQLILVQGDTTSALAAARAASAAGIAVGHVEAGLRSFDLERPWPEEGNRIAIDRIATLLFAPTPGNVANLAADPEVTGTIHLTGNSGIDALLHIQRQSPSAKSHDGRFHILATLHRRETIGEPLERICKVLLRLADQGDVSVTLPLHPNPGVWQIVQRVLDGHDGITLTEPMPYPEMIARMSASDLILSDSGGVQEEAPALGTPLLILRDVTERPEAMACGGAILTGTDPETIWAEMTRLISDREALQRMAVPRFPFGAGDAANRIVAVIGNYLR